MDQSTIVSVSERTEALRRLAEQLEQIRTEVDTLFDIDESKVPYGIPTPRVSVSIAIHDATPDMLTGVEGPHMRVTREDKEHWFDTVAVLSSHAPNRGSVSVTLYGRDEPVAEGQP